jgi:tetratricopeptide (TPR) repeat protein
MNRDRWQQVKDVFDQALELAPDERSSFLDRACSTDHFLRREVESLLSSDDEARSSFWQAPSLTEFTLNPGTKLGPYEIISFIGAGGMGEVYRARDPRLGRDVAIKVLPDFLAIEAKWFGHTNSPSSWLEAEEQDQKAIERFQREARAASALNHPHICTIYDTGEHNSCQFIVMELLEGETLKNHIADRHLEEHEAIKLGMQVVDGLVAAHAKGIIHRDIKPANIFVTTRGEAKLLDFGLSKLTQPLDNVVLPESVTEARVPMGTLPYMAPEQLRGGKTDARTDIWGVGAVLYEMATGERPFREMQGPLLVESIFHQAPQPARVLNPKISGGLERVISKALDKDPSLRYQSAAELGADLQRLSTGAHILVARRKPRWFAAAGVIVLTLALAASWYMIQRRHKIAQPSPPVEVRRSVAILGFQNVAAHPEEGWLSTGLAEMLNTELAAGEKLRTIPRDEVSRMKSDLGITDTDSLPRDMLKRVRENIGADVVVLGSYTALGKQAGGQIRLDIRLQDAIAGETLASVVEVGNEETLFELVSRTGGDLRQKLGLAPLSALDAVAIQASHPSNPEAERLYAEGLAKLRVYDFVAARDLLQKALASDPKYPLVHSALASAWLNLGYDAKATEEAKVAFDLSGNLSREDRLEVEGRYRETAREWDLAVEIYRTLTKFFPDNIDYLLSLGEAQRWAGKMTDTEATLAALRNLPSPERNDPRIDLEEASVANSLSDPKRRLAAASTAAAKANARGARLLVAGARLVEGGAFSTLGESQRAVAAYEEAERIFTAVGYRVGMARAVDQLCNELRDQGNFNQAKKMCEQALAIRHQIGNKDGEAATLVNIADILVNQGDLSGAEALWDQALPLFREVDDKYGMAVVLDNTGIAMTTRGDLLGAKGRLEQALEIYRAMESKTGVANVEGDTGEVLKLLGDLGSARKMIEHAVAVHERTHHKHDASAYLGSLGSVLETQGDLAGARQKNEKALAMHKELGEKGAAAGDLISLGQLSIEEGNAADAEAPLRQAADELRTEKNTDEEARAYIVLARALLAQSKNAPAQETITMLTPLVEKSLNRSIHLSFGIVSAQVRAASGRRGDITQAVKDLQGTLIEARHYHYVGYQFEARLALGQIEMKSGDTAAGRARLAALEADAKAKGFGLIARKAAAKA